MHSLRLEPTKWILIGTRTTYQATGDAGLGLGLGLGLGMSRQKTIATTREPATGSTYARPIWVPDKSQKGCIEHAQLVSTRPPADNKMATTCHVTPALRSHSNASTPAAIHVVALPPPWEHLRRQGRPLLVVPPEGKTQAYHDFIYIYFDGDFSRSSRRYCRMRVRPNSSKT